MKHGLRLLALAVALALVEIPHVLAGDGTIDVAAISKWAKESVMLLVVTDANDNETAVGTGFIVSSDGLLITNDHVVNGARRIVAKAANGGLFPVSGIVARDVENDLAVVRIKGQELPALKLGTTEKLKVGSRLIVIGSPMGLENSVSEGIISAWRNDADGKKRLQVTAAVSPGSSGSPVLNKNGEVIGVAFAQMTEGQSLNFAIPVEAVKALLAQPAEQVELKHTSNEVKVRNSPEYFAFLVAGQQTNNAAAMMKAAQALVKTFPNEALAYVCEGDAYGNASLKKDALASYHHALQLDPKSYDAEMGLGLCYTAANDSTNALEHAEQAVSIRPESATAWFLLGCIRGQIGNFKDAAVALTQSVKLDATNIEAWKYLGASRAQIGDTESARSAYLTYYKLIPKKAEEHWDHQLKAFRERELKGLQGLIASRRDALESVLREARATSDLFAVPDNSKADRLYRQALRSAEASKAGDECALKGEYAPAVHLYEEAIGSGLKNNNADNYIRMALCYGLQGKHNEAIGAFRRALADEPGDFNAMVFLSFELITSEQFTAAQEAIGKCITNGKGTLNEVLGVELRVLLPGFEAMCEARQKTLLEPAGPDNQKSGSDKSQ